MFIKTNIQKKASELLIEHEKKYILLYGGARSGKTDILLYSLIIRALKCPSSRHAILRQAFAHVKASMWYGSFQKIMKNAFLGVKYIENKQDWFIKLYNNSEIWFGGLDDKERTEKILGNEYSTIYLNEASQITYSSYQIATTRLAQKTALDNKIYIDCNPPAKSHWIYSLFIKKIEPETNLRVNGKLYGNIQLNPTDNTENISKNYIDDVLCNLPERQKKRFLYGEFTEDAIGALWTTEMISKTYIDEINEDLIRTIVAIDPAVTSNKYSDETGIIVAGKGEKYYYIIDDVSIKTSPDRWAEIAIYNYDKYNCDRIIGESNQGGDMVDSIIKNKRRSMPVKLVRATKGKYKRAEPIAALYERDLVKHLKRLKELEDQMTTFVPGVDLENDDRLDALVWALTELSEQKYAMPRLIKI